MLFSSPTFLFLFLPAVLVLYLLLPGLRLRNGLLLLTSLLFYAWGESLYVGLLLVSIAGNYAFGQGIALAGAGPWRRRVLIIAVVSNLALLGAFKYTNFLADHIATLLGVDGSPQWSLAPLHLPIGLSFFTFQALSYVIDVYRGRAAVQRNPLDLGLYIALFPQLILGPIVRYRTIARQLLKREVTLNGLAHGSERFIIGLAKKVIIADTLSHLVDPIFALPPGEVGTALAWLGTVGFALQLYFDFSGYADMAVGLGRMFGFTFPENFRHPYTAQSRTVYYQRWHISFSTWMRDYLYGPLTPAGAARWRRDLNLMIVFVLGGLWHGPRGTYLFWGVYNGLLLVAERRWLGQWVKGWWRPWRHVYVLSGTVVSALCFRATSLLQFGWFAWHMAGAPAAGAAQPGALYLTPPAAAALALGAVGVWPVLPALLAWVHRHRPTDSEARAVKWDLAWGGAGVLGLAGMLWVTILMVAAQTYKPFVYFQF